MIQEQEIDAAETPEAPESDVAIDTLVQGCLPAVQRWAHGRLPRAARGQFDTQISFRKRRCGCLDEAAALSRDTQKPSKRTCD